MHDSCIIRISQKFKECGLVKNSLSVTMFNMFASEYCHHCSDLGIQ